MELFIFLDKFYRMLSNDPRIGATHICLYMALIKEWSTKGGINPFPIERDAIMPAAKISARFTYNKCMNNLQEFGYIKYLPSSNSFTQSVIYLKGVEPLYSFCWLNKSDNKAT